MGHLKGSLLILITTLIWGTAFAAQSAGMEHVGPFTFIAARFFIGGLVVLVPSLARARRAKKHGAVRRGLMPAGILTGLVLFGGCAFQQMGIMHTTVGKAGFITSLYVILVPFAAWAVLRKKPQPGVWAGVALAVPGMYLLCARGETAINPGDLMILACAVFFTAHILLVDRFAPKYDGFALSCVQFFTLACVAAIVALAAEQPRPADILACAVPLLYAGALSSGVAFTFQVIAQKSVGPSLAAILFSMESVFAAVSGWLLLGEHMDAGKLAGCALVLAAIAVAQIPRGVAAAWFRKRT